MAETMNRKVQRAVARVEVPATRNDADALTPCHAGSEERQSLDPAGGLG
jgi:hypothetical protein